MKLFEFLKSFLNQQSYDGLTTFRTEKEIIDLLFQDVVDPILVKEENDVCIYNYNYEFPAYECKDGTPHILTLQWCEKEVNGEYTTFNLEALINKYTNVQAAKKIIEAVENFTYDKDFQRILSQIDMCFEDNITEKNLKSLIEQYSDEVEMKKDMKQREEEANEKLTNSGTRYFKTFWVWDDGSESKVILEVEDGKLVVMYDLTRNEEIHDFYDVDAENAVKNCFADKNEEITEEEAQIYIKGNWLEIIILEQGITQYRFAQNCGLDRSLINRIINNNTDIGNIQLNTAYAFAKGLGMTLVEFIEKYYPQIKKE